MDWTGLSNIFSGQRLESNWIEKMLSVKLQVDVIKPIIFSCQEKWFFAIANRRIHGRIYQVFPKAIIIRGKL